MNEFEKSLVDNAFKRCWGMKSALIDGDHNGDGLLFRGAKESLAIQSGLRIKFIEDNLEEILKL